jgi:3-hydroxyisobutyrate dehydrogenase-like beta-hydroxyacid dehydrogenase
VGGSAQDLATCRPVLGAVGSQIEHVGEVGAGTAVKMANQVLLTISLLAAREAAELARGEGVSTERLWEVLRTCTGTTWVVENWPVASSWIDGYRPGTSLDILIKDMGLALELVRDRHLPARMLPLAGQMIEELVHGLAPRGA